MRCGLLVEEQKVVAVVLGDIGDGLTHAMPDIRASLNEVYGTACKKDFLQPTSDSFIIQRSEKSAVLPLHLEHLKQGNKMWCTRATLCYAIYP